MILLLFSLACINAGKESCMTPENFRILTQVVLPASVEKFRCYSENGIDTAAVARFLLPAAEIDPFYRSLGLGVPLQGGQNPLRPETAWPVDWWRAGASGRFRGAEGQVGNRAYKLRIEDREEGKAEVFLLSFSL